MNDGLAFPFTYLAVLVASNKFEFTSWLLDKFFLKIAIGVAIGLVIGWILGHLLKKMPKIKGVDNPHGFVSLSATFLTYGLSEMLHGYGFLAVFVAAITIRFSEEVEGSIKVKMHDFVEEMEKLLLVIWLILFGGSLLNGILGITGWQGFLFASIFILIIRPLAGWIALSGTKIPKLERFAISSFGIRGIGSIFYISWAFMETEAFSEKSTIYSLASWVILLSVVSHGLIAPYVMARLSKESA